MQEVNQTADAEELPVEELKGQFPIPGYIRIRADNHAAAVAKRLNDAGIECYWAWLPIKLGYGKYDEGVALMSLGRPITAIDQFSMANMGRPKSEHSKKKILSVRVADSLYQRICAYAQNHNMNVTESLLLFRKKKI